MQGRHRQDRIEQAQPAQRNGATAEEGKRGGKEHAATATMKRESQAPPYTHTHVPRARGRDGGHRAFVPGQGQGRGRDEEGVQGREKEEAAGQEEGEGIMAWHRDMRVGAEGKREGWLEAGGREARTACLACLWMYMKRWIRSA